MNDVICIRHKRSGESRELFVVSGKDTFDLVDGARKVEEWMSEQVARAFEDLVPENGGLAECPFELVLERDVKKRR